MRNKVIFNSRYISSIVVEMSWFWENSSKLQKPPVTSPGLFISGSWLIMHLDVSITEILILHDDGSHQGPLKFFNSTTFDHMGLWGNQKNQQSTRTIYLPRLWDDELNQGTPSLDNMSCGSTSNSVTDELAKLSCEA